MRIRTYRFHYNQDEASHFALWDLLRSGWVITGMTEESGFSFITLERSAQ